MNAHRRTAVVRLAAPSGFSLTDVMVAIVILSIVATGLFYIASATTLGNTRSKDHAAATALAIEKLEELRNAGFAKLEPGAYEDAMPLEAGGSSVANGIFRRRWQIDDAVLESLPAKQLSVRVEWTGGGEVSLATAIVDVPEDVTGRPSAFVESWSQIR